MGLKTRFLIRKNQNRIKRWFIIVWSLLIVGILGLSYAWTANAYFQAKDRLEELDPLPPQDFDWIAQKIYQNEVGANPDNLTFWHRNEAFPSLGIGHFIWLPAGLKVPFVETFPGMYEYVSTAEPPPEWLKNLHPFKPPWANRDAFYAEFDSPSMVALRNWLRISMRPQAEFIYFSLKRKLPAAMMALPDETRNRVDQRLQELQASKEGRFVLIDYYNFKGLGDNLKERYQEKGWGLLQVLAGMKPPHASESSPKAFIQAFIASAKRVLHRRVALSPPERDERVFLKGWEKRLDTYLTL